MRLTWAGNIEAYEEATRACAALKSKRKTKKQKKRFRKQQRTKGKPTRRVKYADYIQSKEWRLVRAKAIKHHGNKCSICGAVKRLHVHHKTYQRLGQERMGDLKILCFDCHANQHEGKFGVADSITQEYLTLNTGTPRNHTHSHKEMICSSR